MTQAPYIDLSSPSLKGNPYREFERIRSEDPVHLVTLPGQRQGWLITRYEDAERALRDPRFVKDARRVFSPEQLARQFPWLRAEGEATDHDQARIFARGLLNSDPPDHTRLRALVNISFTPRMVERWSERIQQITNALLDAVQAQGKMDVVNDFAFPLPMTVITEMLGVPSKDQTKFRQWSNVIIEASGDPREVEKRYEPIRAYRDYLRYLIDEKRKQPADDLLSHLIETEEVGDKLTEEELISMVSLLLIAGHETTVNLISNGALALLLHPDQKEKLQRDPSLIKSAVEEFLRYHGPLMTATQRWAREDLEFGGKQIRRGDYVLVVLASANHDPQQFDHAEELDVARRENAHLAFGKGIHYCLGAPLARLEGQIAIRTLLQRLPDLRLAVPEQELIWRPGALIMGLRALPVTF
ncbi:cytochrome P450 family protein [Dictyobacter aurantiacus]|uniref:Cytochrome P450 hydroxylase n=1 Tax=Dictyobacter aurantiacus TaxID=1936993 RepID=A0A401ZIC5_9CHLR|nr:cytochrome P450 [Dictyobacter aurantiacus]GCE06611.1 cytochrome P450 hydroxylase [Dictyobacter aurantiacus]